MPSFSAGSGSSEAPVVEPAMYDALFQGVSAKTITGGKFQKNPEGDPKLEWDFLPLDSDDNPLPYVTNEGEAIYEDGDPKEVIVNKLTGTGFNLKSKTTPQEIFVLKALLTTAEFKAFEAGEGTPDSDKDVSEGGLRGRRVQVEVFVKESGWPGVGNVVAPRGGQKGK